MQLLQLPVPVKEK